MRLMLQALVARLRGAPARATCHFCGCTSVLVPPYGKADVQMHPSAPHVSAGTRVRWYCSVCESWNHADEAGQIMDVWERPMWDARLNTRQFAQVPTSAPADAPAPFCRTCLANQTLVINLLANYLSDDDVRKLSSN